MSMLHIDRSVPFDSVTCMGEGWSIVDQDERSLALTEIDLSKVIFHTSETWVEAEGKIRRLREGKYIHLDVQVLQTIWKNQALIPDDWKLKGDIFFNGTIFLDPSGDRYVRCLSWLDDRWYLGYSWFDDLCLTDGPSAVFPC